MKPQTITTDRRAAGSDLDIQHVVCCQDDNLALCGADVSGHPFTDLDTTCVVCDDCDREDVTFCPRVGVCRLQ